MTVHADEACFITFALRRMMRVVSC